MFQLGRWMMGVFFLLMLVVPTTLQQERGGLLALLLSGSILILIKSPNRWRISAPVLFWLFACVIYSSLSVLWGLVNDAHGAIAVSTVYIIWPILYIYYIGFVKTAENYVVFVKILLVGIFISALSGVLFVSSGFFPSIEILKPYFDLLDGSLGLYESSIAYTLSNMSTVIYGLSFTIGLSMLGFRTSIHFSWKWRIFGWIVLLISFFVMIISGRKAFILVGLVAVPLSLILMHISGVAILKFKLFVKVLVFGICVVFGGALIFPLVFGVDLSSIFENFLTGFDFGNINNISASRRGEQFNALIEEWKISPFIGSGHGSNARGSPGDVLPWAYELQYIALLFQTGILGMLVYGSSVVWLMYQMIRLSRKYADLAILMFPSLIGLVCFLIANATNPYLSKFDCLWVIFLPVGLVNMGLLRDSAMRFVGKRFCVNV